MDCFFVVLKCRVCDFFRTFRFSRFLHVSFFKSSTFRFARKGYGVAINYNKSETDAQTLVNALQSDGTHAAALMADVSDMEQVRSMIESCEKQFGHIDVLINNAGIAQQKLFTDLTADDWNRMFAVDVTGFVKKYSKTSLFCNKKCLQICCDTI